MKLNNKNFEHNDSNHETDAQLDELIEIGKNLIKVSDSISADILLHSLEESQKRNEIYEMQKQINYLKTELEKLRKNN
ncbi:hypothetical protein [Oceanobacillus chungangensis]|uniref:Uncharacterized protein n=1 Tax=Oceanobacillus chungangensis TaxID=1229152 RepID=A0A3D8PNL4_9BACI|nr:hypothetical protein [Oceanobacillus chungangensis]RDW17690.1 hypothetical protein CWR45_10110 [Oceanobacillus chungangensis]